MDLAVWPTACNWDESSLTWASAPAEEDFIIRAASVPKVNDEVWFDVSETIKESAVCLRTYSYILKTQENAVVSVYSRESDYGPKLRVRYVRNFIVFYVQLQTNNVSLTHDAFTETFYSQFLMQYDMIYLKSVRPRNDIFNAS